MDSADTVTISKVEYQELIQDQKFLRCLEGAGVDNWDGYDFAREEYNMANPDED